MSGKSNPDYSKLTDEQLILKFQKEDMDAFNEIIYRYKDRLVNFLFRYIGNKEDAEDFAHDTFLKLYKIKHLYREMGKFSTWFYTVALNLARTNLKTKARYRFIYINNFDKDEKQDYDLPSNMIAPDESANARNESYYIQKALDSLNKKSKEVIILSDIQDLDYEEIAKILAIPIGTVRSRINRARQHLKVMLEEVYKPKKL